LTQGLQAALEIFGSQHLVKQRAWQGFAGVHMRSHVFEDRPFPTKVFHELAWQFHRVPFHPADARNIALIDLGEHVVQAMAAFMKQSDHIVMREQRRLSVDALCKVADQMRHRRLQMPGVRA
jgi:hypothetical protein